MSPLTALMPTHAAITGNLDVVLVPAGATSIPIRAAEVQSSPAPHPMLHKYIILERDGREYPLVFSREIQHSHVVPWKEGYTPVSAGSFIICGSELRLSPGPGCPGAGSSTLEIDPRPQDETILRAFLAQPASTASAVNPVTSVNQVIAVS